MNQRRAIFDLFLISALGLFVELVFIRWVGSELRIFGFYKNLVLIAAFLGLGIGFAIDRKTDGVGWFAKYYLLLVALTSTAVIWLGRSGTVNRLVLSHSNPQEFVWAQTLIDQTGQSIPILDILFYATILALFLLICVVFIPLGQLTARKFKAFPALRAYTINVTGSLFGILIYTLISFVSWPPQVWFLISGLGALYFLPHNSWKRFAIYVALASVPAALTALWPINADRTIWSPYYRIDITADYSPTAPALLTGYTIAVNQSYHQRIFNLSPEFVREHYDRIPEYFDEALAEYDTPYAVAARLDRVLVVGAGSGNDVAAGLRANAKSITAVEIDPAIFQLGRELHAEHPYDDPRVIQDVQDARSFFSSDSQQYDLIVFGLLDSHTLFSAASSVRLDNFVYTRESLSAVRHLLAEDGVLALSFAVPEDRQWVGLRLYRTLTDVFGYSPEVYTCPNDVTLFLISQNPERQFVITNPRVEQLTNYSYQPGIDASTDDWPFLYLQGRLIPTTYIVILVGVLVISLPMIRIALPDFRQINWHFLFMGAAFFLLETKSITEMALLFGSTWIVNSVVIAAILIMIIAANMLVERFGLPDPRLFYALLTATLLFDYFVPVSSYLALPPPVRFTLAALTQAAPLFCAGIIFAVTFARAQSIEVALGSNLLGAVVGGIVEYSSLALGIRSLYLLALGFYLLSLIAWLIPYLRARQSTTG